MRGAGKYWSEAVNFSGIRKGVTYAKQGDSCPSAFISCNPFHWRMPESLLQYHGEIRGPYACHYGGPGGSGAWQPAASQGTIPVRPREVQPCSELWRGELEGKYKTLQAEYNESEAKADEVRARITAVEDVSEALFDEWENELDQYTNKSLKRDSEKKLVQTRRQYDQLIKAMRRAEAKIDPVLKAFRDQVLYLKHNLNAQAVASLKSELAGVESDTAALIKEMEKSIGEANSFIRTMLEE
jgi:hypothetical protein